MDPIAVSLMPLFEEAEKTGKWFWCNYQDLWFSPAQLRAEQAQGRFRWGAVNWKLRDPNERLAEAEAKASAANNYVERVRAAIGSRA